MNTTYQNIVINYNSGSENVLEVDHSLFRYSQDCKWLVGLWPIHFEPETNIPVTRYKETYFWNFIYPLFIKVKSVSDIKIVFYFSRDIRSRGNQKLEFSAESKRCFQKRSLLFLLYNPAINPVYQYKQIY